MSYGMIIRGDNGTLLANTEYPTYVLHEVLSPISSDGNVLTYLTTSPTEPLVFINIPNGASAGVLNIEATSGGYYIRVIANTGVTIYVFRVIQNSDGATGYGANFYNASGYLTYSTIAKVLLVDSVQSVSVGSVFNHHGSTLVSHSAANTYATKSNNDHWVYTGVMIPMVTLEPVLTYECHVEQSYQCSYDLSGMFVCTFVPYTVCSYVTVPQLVTHYIFVFAHVITTTWQVYRGCLKNLGAQFAHDWVLHRSGYYNTVLEYGSAVTSQTYSGGGMPGGYTPPAFLMTMPELYGYDGEFTYNNTFPYADGISNNITATAVLTKATNYV